MKCLALMLVAAMFVLAGCGGDDDTAGSQPGETAEAPAAEAEEQPAAEKDRAEKPPAEKKGTTVIVAGSDYGDMLYGADKQAIYIFENDPKGESACYGECAEAWPPVYTDGEPQAGDGVKAGLLGTTKRRDGKLQVTYDGKPLYFYVNEGPGEVRCHNIELNGGLWWVVGPDGERRP